MEHILKVDSKILANPSWYSKEFDTVVNEEKLKIFHHDNVDPADIVYPDNLNDLSFFMFQKKDLP
jgi:hypothetical protein